MEITRLRYFCAIVETGSVRRAAELLHVSPGALSKALAQVEELAGVPLFARVGRAIALTDAGRAFHGRAAKVIEAYGALANAAARPRTAHDDLLRVGSFEVFTTHLLGHVIARERTSAPVTAHELVPERMEEAILKDEVDFGLTYAPVAMAGIEFLPLGELVMGIFGQETFRKAPFEELAFAVPITPIGGHVAGMQSLDGWPNDAPPRTIRYRFELLESALVLAREGRAVVHCPSFVVKLSNRHAAVDARLVPLPLPGKMTPVRAPVYLVKRASEPETARLRRWACQIRQILAS